MILEVGSGSLSLCSSGTQAWVLITELVLCLGTSALALIKLGLHQIGTGELKSSLNVAIFLNLHDRKWMGNIYDIYDADPWEVSCGHQVYKVIIRFILSKIALNCFLYKNHLGLQIHLTVFMKKPDQERLKSSLSVWTNEKFEITEKKLKGSFIYRPYNNFRKKFLICSMAICCDK